MRVVFYDVSHVLARGNARAVGFRELLEMSDVVTLHVDGKPANQNLFGADEFAAMKNGGCFLNLSRGFVVDHEALASCLRRGKIIVVRPEHDHGAPSYGPGRPRTYVYRRAGEPCRVCGTTISTAELEGRNVFWCQTCQT